jgi:hypothetical protein
MSSYVLSASKNGVGTQVTSIQLRHDLLQHLCWINILHSHAVSLQLFFTGEGGLTNFTQKRLTGDHGVRELHRPILHVSEKRELGLKSLVTNHA